jgi:acyl carrier protein
MNHGADEIRSTVKAYLTREHLTGMDPEDLDDSRPLVTGGVLDSLASLRLVTFLEEAYGIRVEAHEVAVENLDTVTDIVRFVLSKIPG